MVKTRPRSFSLTSCWVIFTRLSELRLSHSTSSLIAGRTRCRRSVRGDEDENGEDKNAGLTDFFSSTSSGSSFTRAMVVAVAIG